MPDRETVIDKLNDMADYLLTKSYSDLLARDFYDTVGNAIDLLKEQETTDTRKSRIFQCEKCGYGIEDIFLNSEYDYPIVPDYCPNCGRKVK